MSLYAFNAFCKYCLQINHVKCIFIRVHVPVVLFYILIVNLLVDHNDQNIELALHTTHYTLYPTTLSTGHSCQTTSAGAGTQTHVLVYYLSLDIGCLFLL